MCDVWQLSRQMARRGRVEAGSRTRRIICAVRVTPSPRKGGGTARLLGVQAAGCPAVPLSFRDQMLECVEILDGRH